MGGLESGPGELATTPLLQTAEEAAEVLRVGRTTMYALIRPATCIRCTSGPVAASPARSSSATSAAWEPRAGAPAIGRAQADDRARARSSSWTRHRRTPSESTGGSLQ